MLAKFVSFFIQRSVKGPAQSWVFTSVAMMALSWAKKKVAKSETIELQNLKPGDRYVIEHLPITHGEQLKAEKSARKDAKSAAKAEKKALKRAKKSK